MPIDETIRSQLKPGATVKVTQQIAARNYSLSSDIRGIVVEFRQKQTGSWFAHGRNDKLWLDRLTLRKPDGELFTLTSMSSVRWKSRSPRHERPDGRLLDG